VSHFSVARYPLSWDQKPCSASPTAPIAHDPAHHLLHHGIELFYPQGTRLSDNQFSMVRLFHLSVKSWLRPITGCGKAVSSVSSPLVAGLGHIEGGHPGTHNVPRQGLLSELIDLYLGAVRQSGYSHSTCLPTRSMSSIATCIYF
jgi:hypothetical protein